MKERRFFFESFKMGVHHNLRSSPSHMHDSYPDQPHPLSPPPSHAFIMFYVENNKAIQNENTHLLSGQVFQFRNHIETLARLRDAAAAAAAAATVLVLLFRVYVRLT